MTIKAKKLSETWCVTQNNNRALITVHPDFTYDIQRIRVNEKSFITEAVKTLTNLIQI